MLQLKRFKVHIFQNVLYDVQIYKSFPIYKIITISRPVRF